MMAGAFDKTAISVMAFTHPRPPLGLFQSPPRPSLVVVDPEAQQHDLVGREVRQQEATYLQLMTDLQRPTSRTGSPTLPNQTPRMVQRDPVPSSLAAYPAVTSLSPPVAVPAPIASLGAVQLKRGLSVRSVDSTVSEYSVASAIRDPQDRTYKPFALTLPTVPASPAAPQWPSSPRSYIWPKRQPVSQIREELAPETYAMRWKTDESVEPPAAIPVAQAVPSTPTGLIFGAPPVRPVLPPISSPLALRIHVPPPVHYPDSPTSATTAHLYYANASSATTSPKREPPPQPF
ncbi:hypothetical protein K438DRAFT_1809763 [Mycena galopus ATCC 62051]|nr:hypothetical protein K438DRAFT_1809763 [Mycena galopus ATCC 62051]